MKQNPLKIVQVNASQSQSRPPAGNSSLSRRKENEARLERKWLLSPQEFDPMRNALEREGTERSWNAVLLFQPLGGKSVADIGCGMGTMVRRLNDAGAVVTAVDIAGNALKHLEKLDKVTLSQDALPKTRLPDDAFDLVLCLNVIADLHPEDFRLAMAELVRIVKAEGSVICSTPLDIHSEDALERFASLASTEFKIHDWILSYNAYYVRFMDFLKAPGRLYRAWKEPEYRKTLLQNRGFLGRTWVRLNSFWLLAPIWGAVAFVLSPLVHFCEQSRTVLIAFEKMCHFFSGERGVSHAIFIATRRPLFEEPMTVAEQDAKTIPDRAPFKKERKWE